MLCTVACDNWMQGREWYASGTRVPTFARNTKDHLVRAAGNGDRRHDVDTLRMGSARAKTPEGFKIKDIVLFVS